ncbi:MAG TPA: hypothetical protein VNM22_16080 [Candidatus Limnocylindrales bacterium]|nr:hypothetical protein [Candidatus Limnocylindrales bacterium]
MQVFSLSDREKLEQLPAEDIVEYFKKIPDITEYTLDCNAYPLSRLEKLKKILSEAVESVSSQSESYNTYDKILKRLSGLITTRVDYVKGFIQQVLGKESPLNSKYFLETAPTSDILHHVDLMKDVGISPEMEETEYNEVLQKLVKVLKFRFNEALSIYKELYSTTYEEIAKNKTKFPQQELEQYKRFLEDALLMTKTHITVKPQQIQQLKGTLIKILEALAVRALESVETFDKSQYRQILNLIETNISGLEAEFAHEIIERFSNLIPEAIAEKYPLTIIRHNRKLAELLIEISKPSESILDLYDILISFTIAEAEKIRSLRIEKQEPADSPLEVKITPGEREIQEEMKHFETLTLTQKALALIRLSFYGLFETLSSLTLEELNKYPIGVLKSAEKTLKELEQQELSEKEIQIIRTNTDYIKALELLDKAIADYKTLGEKYDFISLYRETDYEVQGVSYCTFNDLILRMIQNIGEANFILNSTGAGISAERQHELTVTITERYRQEWKRQREAEEKEEELELVKLAERNVLPDKVK